MKRHVFLPYVQITGAMIIVGSNIVAGKLLSNATRETGDERPVLIMAQDEGCFGRINRAKRCWASPGMRPHVPVRTNIGIRDQQPTLLFCQPSLHLVGKSPPGG